MSEQKYKEIIFMLKQRIFRQNATSVYHDLKLNEKRTPEEINEINFTKRLKMIKYAYNNVTFYKNHYNSNNFHPNDIITPDDWNKVPIVTKEMIINNLQDFVSKNTKKKYFKKSSTGGSTGVPLTVYHDRRFPVETIGWRLLDWWDIKKGNNIAFALRNTRNNLVSKWSNRVLWFPTKRIWIDAKKMSEHDIKIFLNEFNRIKPTILQGYVGAITHIAEYIAENEISVYSPSAVWVTSSPITETQRNIIKNAFQTNIYDQYGCGEVFWIAAQCREVGGLHVFSDVRHLEYVNTSGFNVQVGEFGDALITDLENYVFPIIRYKNGDRGRYLKHECECGLPFPVIDSVKGRITDMIKSLNGDTISGDYLTTIFDEYPEAIQGFQIHQKEDYSIDFLVIPNNRLPESKKIIENIFRDFRSRLDEKQTVSLIYKRKLMHDGGKTRFVISDIN
jgi:phenylacetate-CoA ligase